MKKKVGVVLSGGGVRGIAHIGFLKALTEFDIFPDYVSGCSSGAIVAGLYCAGCDFQQILDYFYDNAKIFKLSAVSTNKVGIFDSDKYISTLDPIIKNDNFSDLQKRLIVTATDITIGQPVYFSEGNNVKKKIIASAAVPGIFSPVIINDTILVDGGTMDNFPVAPLLDKDLTIFGSFVSIHDTIAKELGDGFLGHFAAGHCCLVPAGCGRHVLCQAIAGPGRRADRL